MHLLGPLDNKIPTQLKSRLPRFWKPE